MSDGSTNKALQRDDLFLLLDSYKNSIELNATVLEQTRKVVDRQNQILSEQKQLLDKVGKVIDSLSVCEKSSHELQKEVLSALSGNDEKMTSYHTENIKTHNSILGRVNWGIIGMSSIVISLIGLISTIIWKANVILAAIQGIVP